MLITPGWGTEVPGRFKESQLLEQIRVRAATLNAPGLVVGPGDDCAVVQTAAGSTVLLTVDQLTVGRHVTAATSIDLIARKAIARSVSDIAAMAAVPKWSLVSGLLSDGMSEAAANELCESLHRWGLFFDAPVVGGDIASGPADAPLTLSVTVMGELAAGDAPFCAPAQWSGMPCSCRVCWVVRSTPSPVVESTLSSCRGSRWPGPCGHSLAATCTR